MNVSYIGNIRTEMTGRGNELSSREWSLFLSGTTVCNSSIRASGFQSTFFYHGNSGSSKHNNQFLETTICWVKVVRRWILFSFFLSFKLGFPQNRTSQDISHGVLNEHIWLWTRYFKIHHFFFIRLSNVRFSWMLKVMHTNGASL